MLELRRDTFTDDSTIGDLYGNGDHLCDTLEDTVREEGVKIYGKTAIPTGTYEIILRYSNHFKREMPFLENVPGYEGVMLHWGNRSSETLGCILVGIRPAGIQDFIGHSVVTFNTIVFPWIEEAIKKGRVFIEIQNEGQWKDEKNNVETI